MAEAKRTEAFSKDGLLHVIKDDAAHKYTINSVPVPGVTTILGCLQKGGLSWWGMRVGIQGVTWLAREGYVNNLTFSNPSADETIEGLLKTHKRTVNHTLDKAGARGSSVHKAAEDFAETGSIPNLSDYSREERGYVRAFCKFVIENEPVYEASEVIVGWWNHEAPLLDDMLASGFAGTFDGIATLKKGDYQGQRVLFDLKTSKGIYPDSHFPQLEAYEAANCCMGNEPTDNRLLIRLGADAEYEIAQSVATFDDFLGIKSAYDSVQRLKEAVKQAKKEAKARG